MADCRTEMKTALDMLEHFHCEHTSDAITRFHGRGRVDVYVVSDQESRAEFRALADRLTKVTNNEKLIPK